MVSTRLMRGSIILLLVLTLISVFPPSVNATRAQSKSTSPLIILKYGDLWAWDAITEQVHQLTHHQSVSYPILSPDGNWVAYLVTPEQSLAAYNGYDSSSNLWVLDLVTGKEIQITEQPPRLRTDDCFDCPPLQLQTIHAVLWSPDSKSLYWHSVQYHRYETDAGIEESSTSALWRSDVATGKQAQITTTLKNGAERYGLSVSADGKKLAWIKVTRPTAEQEQAYVDGSGEKVSWLFQLVIHDIATGHQILTEIPASYGDMGGFAPIDILWEGDWIGLSYSGPASYSPSFVYDSQGNKLYPFTEQSSDTSQDDSMDIENPEGYPGALHWYTYESKAYFVAGSTLIDLSQKTTRKLDPDIAIESYSHNAPDGYAVRKKAIVDNSGQLVYELPSNVTTTAIDPTGQYVAFADTNGTVRVWNGRTQTVTVLNYFDTVEQPENTSTRYFDTLLWSQIDQRLRPVKQ